MLLRLLAHLFFFQINLLQTNSTGMQRRSDVSFRFHIGWNVVDHAETDLFVTSVRRFIGT